MYGDLLDALAQDYEHAGPVADVLSGHENDSGPSALGLRLVGSVHRLVLGGHAQALEAFYPTTGGTWDPVAGPAAVVEYLREHTEAAREWLDRAPQTNEVGRATALYGALLALPLKFRLPVHVFEIGASGGLNLLADRYTYRDADGTRFGDPSQNVVLEPAWQPAPLTPWPELGFEAAHGCDLHPIPAGTDDGRLALRAYVWPDQDARHQRLRAALDLAATHPPQVHAQGAGDFVEGLTLQPGKLTVLWHSIMWQYLPPAEQQRITAKVNALGMTATEESPFAHIRLEPQRRGADERHQFLVTVTSWPYGQTQDLGVAAPHGLPITWAPATDES